MKHQIIEDVNVNVNVEFDKDDVIEVVDHVQMAVITIIVVGTAAHILKAVLK